MTEVTANVELLDRALADIDAEAFLWKQSAWISFTSEDAYAPAAEIVAKLADIENPPCGTGLCLFGWGAWHAGYRPVHNRYQPIGQHWAPIADIKAGNGEVAARHIMELGAELFGVSHNEAIVLSDEDNKREDLQTMRDMLARGESIKYVVNSHYAGDDYDDDDDDDSWVDEG